MSRLLFELINRHTEVGEPRLGDSYNDWWRTKYVPAWFLTCQIHIHRFNEEGLSDTALALSKLMIEEANSIGYDLNLKEFIK